jgi:methyl coenzyme M reductase beta subunit
MSLAFQNAFTGTVKQTFDQTSVVVGQIFADIDEFYQPGHNKSIGQNLY